MTKKAADAERALTALPDLLAVASFVATLHSAASPADLMAVRVLAQEALNKAIGTPVVASRHGALLDRLDALAQDFDDAARDYDRRDAAYDDPTVARRMGVANGFDFARAGLLRLVNEERSRP